MPVELLAGARLVGRAAQPHAVGLLYFRPTDHALVGLAIRHAAPPRTVRLIDYFQRGFHFHVLFLLHPKTELLPPYPRFAYHPPKARDLARHVPVEFGRRAADRFRSVDREPLLYV